MNWHLSSSVPDKFSTSTISIVPLQRAGANSILSMIIQSGAKFIGLVPEASQEEHSASYIQDVDIPVPNPIGVMRLITVPLSNLLLAVGYRTLALWSHWTNLGSHKLLWEAPIRKTIKEDILEALALLAPEVEKEAMVVRLVDACLMQMEPGAGKAVLVVLAVAISPAIHRTQHSLWLHSLEIQMSSHEDSGGSEAVVLSRLLISKNIRFGSSFDKPRLCSLAPCLRVFVSWTDAIRSPGNLFCAQFDVLNQPVVKHLRRDGTVELDALKCGHAIDCGISSTTVICQSAVRGLDGVCAVLDGEATFLPSSAGAHSFLSC